MRKFQWMSTLLTGLGFLLAIGSAHAESHCDNKSPWTYRAQPGDLSSSTQLDIQRSFSGLHSLHVDVCEGELRLLPAPRDSKLRIEVTSPGAEKPLGSYVQTVDAKDGEATITLQFPKNAHATVTLHLPQEEQAKDNEINLGAGTLRYQAHALRGNREINLGAGSIYAELDGDHDYAAFEANIGVGRLSDERPNGHGAFGIISRNSQGSGSGDLKINVGAGSIHLIPDREAR